MSDQAQILHNIEEIRALSARIQGRAPQCASPAEFYEIGGDCIDCVSYLMRVAASFAPDALSTERGYSRNRAIVVGHIVRLSKLCDGLRSQYESFHGDLCGIMGRLMLETATRAEYLMKAKRSSFSSFILGSYRPERSSLAYLQGIAEKRPLIPIERRMLDGMKYSLRRDGITLRALMENKRWDMDGKSFKLIEETVRGSAWGYSFGFGGMSHFVHGDWRDIGRHHLRRRGRYYLPNLEQYTPDPRFVCPIGILCLKTLLVFLKWNKSDPDQVLRRAISELRDALETVEISHEGCLSRPVPK